MPPEGEPLTDAEIAALRACENAVEKSGAAAMQETSRAGPAAGAEAAPSGAALRDRARAAYIHVLLNHNDFVTIRKSTACQTICCVVRASRAAHSCLRRELGLAGVAFQVLLARDGIARGAAAPIADWVPPDGRAHHAPAGPGFSPPGGSRPPAAGD